MGEGIEGFARLNRDGIKRWFSGHPWIYGDQVLEVRGDAGAFVEVTGPESEFLGTAMYSPNSKIRLRRFSFDAIGKETREEVRDRLKLSAERRGKLLERTDSARIVSSEADRLPGLIVDKYKDVYVLQTLTVGMERILDRIVEVIRDLFKPRMIVARNDSHVRDLEGLARETRLVYGERVESLMVEEEGLFFTVEPFRGQKTGLYLDQRGARKAVRLEARGRRVLDLFAYQGGFSMNALKGGARSAVAVEASSRAIEIIKKDCTLNSLGRIETVKANVFQVLPEMEKGKEVFDLIVLDPPAFAKSKKEKKGAVKGYLELHRRVFKILARGGLLLTSSCSYNLSEAEFLEIIRKSARDAGRYELHLKKLEQEDDHPVLLGLPESRYLKTFIIKALDGPARKGD